MSWDSYRDLHNPTIRALMSRIECVHDPQIEAEFPANMSGTVTVHTRGRTYVKTVIVPLGEPTNFLGQDAILAKYAGLAQTALGDRTIGLANCALGFDALPSIRDLTRWSAVA
jgi:2-methylcitrate dehydratase PrpD